MHFVIIAGDGSFERRELSVSDVAELTAAGYQHFTIGRGHLPPLVGFAEDPNAVGKLRVFLDTYDSTSTMHVPPMGPKPDPIAQAFTLPPNLVTAPRRTQRAYRVGVWLGLHVFHPLAQRMGWKTDAVLRRIAALCTWIEALQLYLDRLKAFVRHRPRFGVARGAWVLDEHVHSSITAGLSAEVSAFVARAEGTEVPTCAAVPYDPLTAVAAASPAPYDAAAALLAIVNAPPPSHFN
jgi:hypothetical protein